MQARHLRIAVIVAAASLIGAQLIGAQFVLSRWREVALAGAAATVERVARTEEANVNRHFLQVDGMLAGLPGMLSTLQGNQPLTVDSVSRVLLQANYQNFSFRDIILLRPDGTPWATALPASRGRPLPLPRSTILEEIVRRPGAVAIAGPARNPATSDWSIYFIRQIMLPQLGPFFAVAEVPVPLIESLFAPSANIPGLHIELERGDGTLLASQPHDETRIGHRLAPTAMSMTNSTSSFDAMGRLSRHPAIVAVRHSLYPNLAVVAELDTGAALTDFNRDRNRLLTVGTSFSVLLALLASALLLALRQRERSENERAVGRAMLENAIESMPDGFVMYDRNDRLIVCNQRYRDMYHISAPFIVPGAYLEDIIRQGALRGQYPQAGDDIETFVSETRAWHRANNPPMERMLPDGRWLLVTERATPDGGTVGIRTDVTELKRAMDELAAARDAASASTEAKSRFLARMSHELRTPLNGVLGLAQALARDPTLGTVQRERAALLETAGRHLLAVANDVLDLAQVEAGRMDLHPVPVEFPQLIHTCLALIRPAVDEKRIDLSSRLSPELPAVVSVDATRFRQLLLNLLSNAVKFTPEEGRVMLVARPVGLPDEHGRARVRVEIHDTGPGVPLAARQAIFGDFVQLGGSSIHGGTGLGLAIAARITELMGGTIACEDNPAGRGALFWAEMPLPLAEMQVAPPVPERLLTHARNLKILVADDVAGNLAVARTLLENTGAQVECVESGAEAVAAVEKAASMGAPYNLVLMDVMMPEMDGMDATRHIRALAGPASEVTVLAVTASAFHENIAACRAAGMDGHLSKPIDRDALLGLLDSMVDADGHRKTPVTLPQPAAFPPSGGMAAGAPMAAVSARGEAAAEAIAAPVDDIPLLAEQSGAEALKAAGLDSDEAGSIAALFMQELETALDDAAAALAHGPAAHRVAGAAAALGASRLSAVARRLQVADAAQAAPLKVQLMDVGARTMEALHAQNANAMSAGR